MMVNPAAAAQLAQKMSDQELSQAAQGRFPNPNFPLWAATTEMQRRAAMRQGMQGMQAMRQNAQDKTVLEDLLDGKPIQPQGIGSLPAMTDPNMQGTQGNAAQPQTPDQQSPMAGTQPATASPRGYASGGLVAFDGGGPVDNGPASGYTQPYYPRGSSQPPPGFYDSFVRPLGAPFRAFADWTTRGAPRGRSVQPRPMDTTPAMLRAQTEGWTADENGEPVRTSDLIRGLQPLAEPDLNDPVIGGVGDDDGSTGGVGGGLGSLTGSPVSPSMPDFLTKAMKDTPSLEALVAQRRALLPSGQAHEGLAAEAEAMKGRIAERTSAAKGEGLLRAGLGMMASRSQYFGNAVGEGGAAGLKQYIDEKKDIDRLEQLRVQYASTVEAARRAEAIGNVDAADKMQSQAETIRAHILSAQASYAAHDVSSQRSLQGHLAMANAHNAYRKQAADDRHEDRVAAIEAGVFRQAYDKAMSGLKDNPQSMMMTDDQKEQLALSRARNELAAWRSARSGITSLESPVAPGAVRGKLDASGNLTR